MALWAKSVLNLALTNRENLTTKEAEEGMDCSGCDLGFNKGDLCSGWAARQQDERGQT